MTRGTSSAVPEELIRYSLRAVQIDNELVSESHRLSRALDSFERTCRERQFRVHVSHLDDALRSYASETENTDRWVRTVGLGFQEADRRAWIERLGNAAIGRVVTLPWTGGNAAVTAILEPGWTLWRLIHPEHRAVLEVAAIAAPGFMIALKAIELARDAVAEVKEGVTWVRGEGIRRTDDLVLDKVDAVLPENVAGEDEFAGLKAKGKVIVPGAVLSLVGLPPLGTSVYLEGGADVRITREEDEDGKEYIILKLSGMYGAGMHHEDGAGVSELEIGLRGRAGFEFRFDPEDQGDMTAMARLLAEAGGGAAALSSPGMGMVVGGIAYGGSQAFGLIAGEQANYWDNIESGTVEGGLAGKAEIGYGGIGYGVSGERLWGTGMEKGPDGQLRQIRTFRTGIEGKASFYDVKGKVAIEYFVAEKTNPPGTELRVSLEGTAGGGIDVYAPALKEMGLYGGVDLEIAKSGKIEVIYRTDRTIDSVASDLLSGEIGWSDLKEGHEVDVKWVTRTDNSLEGELGATLAPGQTARIEGSVTSYSGSEKILYHYPEGT